MVESPDLRRSTTERVSFVISVTFPDPPPPCASPRPPPRRPPFRGGLARAHSDSRSVSLHQCNAVSSLVPLLLLALSRGMLWRTGGDPNTTGVAPPVGQPEVSMEAAPPHPVDRPSLPLGTLVVPSSSQQISDPLVCQEPADTEHRSSRHPFLISPAVSSAGLLRRARPCSTHLSQLPPARIAAPRRPFGSGDLSLRRRSRASIRGSRIKHGISSGETGTLCLLAVRELELFPM